MRPLSPLRIGFPVAVPLVRAALCFAAAVVLPAGGGRGARPVAAVGQRAGVRR